MTSRVSILHALFLSTVLASKLIQDGEYNGCWEAAVTKFFQDNALNSSKFNPSSKSACDGFTETQRKGLALFLTECHVRDRPGSFPSGEEICNMSSIVQTMTSPEVEGGHLLKDSLINCIFHMTDSTFQVYTEFFNHLDNVCFYINSVVWQRKTERMVSSLTSATEVTLRQLDIAASRQISLLEGQHDLMEEQSRLVNGSRQLRVSLEQGQSELQFSFSRLREDVERENQRVHMIFSEIGEFFQRILSFQATIRAQIHDLGTLVVYVTTTVTTYYITASERVQGSRATLYACWTIMAVGELLIHRLAPVTRSLLVWTFSAWRWLLTLLAAFIKLFIHPFHNSKWMVLIKDPNLCAWEVFVTLNDSSVFAAYLISRWRWMCLLGAISIWFKYWWSYRDVHALRVIGMESQLNEIQKALKSVLSNSSSGISAKHSQNHHESRSVLRSLDLFFLAKEQNTYTVNSKSLPKGAPNIAFVAKEKPVHQCDTGVQGPMLKYQRGHYLRKIREDRELRALLDAETPVMFVRKLKESIDR